MLRAIVTGLIVFIGFIMQVCVFPGVLPLEVMPNLLILLTAVSGFMGEEKAGLLVGFACGFLYDVFFCDIVGFHALIYMYIGFLNGKFSRIFYPEDIKLPLALITVSDLSYCLLNYVLSFLLRGRFDFGFYMFHIILPEMICTLLLTLFVYPVLLKLHKVLQKRERRSEQRFV